MLPQPLHIVEKLYPGRLVKGLWTVCQCHVESFTTEVTGVMLEHRLARKALGDINDRRPAYRPRAFHDSFVYRIVIEIVDAFPLVSYSHVLYCFAIQLTGRA